MCGSWRILAEVSIQADNLGHCSLEQLQASLSQAAYKAKQMRQSVSTGARDVENHQEILCSEFSIPEVRLELAHILL